MGILGDLIDDVLDLPGKVVRKSVDETKRAACVATGGHEWGQWTAMVGGGAYRRCAECETEERRGR